jgi:drug/metabolite transporter superfamily protein YnfA
MKSPNNMIAAFGGLLIGVSVIWVIHHHQTPPAHAFSSAIVEGGFIVAGLFLVVLSLKRR